MSLTPRPASTAISPALHNVSGAINPAINSSGSADKSRISQITSNTLSLIGHTDLSSTNLYAKPLTVAPPSVLYANINNALGYGLTSPYSPYASYSPWMMQGAQNTGYGSQLQARNAQELERIANEQSKVGNKKAPTLNSTNGKSVSWMGPDGNMLSTELLDKTDGGTAFGKAVNELAGDTLTGGGAPQETTLRGVDGIENVADDLGSPSNPVAENIVLGDTNHGSDGDKFKADGENVSKASNAKDTSNFSDFSEFKDYLLKRGAEALKTGENLVVTIAAHGSPDGGVSVNGQHISKDELNELLDLAGIKVTINCPCYSQLGVA